MYNARFHWIYLQSIKSDLARRVRSFMMIGLDGNGVLITTEDGLTYWIGSMKFGSNQSRTSTANEPTPLDVFGVISMAQGDNHIVMINKRGVIYTMGQNNRGQLGTVVEEESCFTPRSLISIVPNIKFISVRCGRSYSLALTEDGKVWAWGDNHYGQIGLPKSSADIVPFPHQILQLTDHRIVAVECGGHHSLALTDRGEVYGWGKNVKGQLGSNNKSAHIPTRIAAPAPVKSMTAGLNHTLLLTETGDVYACGWNRYCQLGIPKTKFSTSLVKVEGLPLISQIIAHPATSLSVAMSSTFSSSDDNQNRCFVWGQLNDEYYGDDDFDDEQIGKYISISTPRELSPYYPTVDTPLAMYSLYQSTPYAVSIPETPLSLLSTRMSRMFDNPETSDVRFVVEQNRTIHAHRNILCNFSEYFGRMFSERCQVQVDPQNPTVKVIPIPDYSYEAFHAFLRFIYIDRFEVHFDILPELFELATQYLIPELQQLCLSRMRITLIPATCCHYYPLTQRHSLLPELATFQQELVQFVSTRMSEVVQSDAYKSMESDLRNKLTNAAQNLPGN